MSKRIIWLSVAVILVVAVGLVVALRPPGEPLTPEKLEAAEKVWRAHNLMDYDMEVEISGAQQGLHTIRVRGGDVVEMSTGGAKVPPNVWKYWSVQGMFGFLAEELENRTHPKMAFGVDDPSQVILRAYFDPELGYPRRFLRHVQGGSVDIMWVVRKFRRAEDGLGG